MAEERVSKILAAAGVASRRGADALIAAGRVAVDGRVVTLGATADPGRSTITVDGHAIRAEPPAPVYLALNKPLGVTSTVRDRHATRTVLELIPRQLAPGPGRLFPVGRLDRDSEGLLLLTNDGTWADRILHPRYEVDREYLVGLRGRFDDDQLRALRRGITLDEGVATFDDLRSATRTAVRAMSRVIDPPPGPDLVWYSVILGQGWRRQVRRMLAAVGVPVERLVRIRIGSLDLDGLAWGAVRVLSPREVGALAEPRARRSEPAGREANPG